MQPNKPMLPGHRKWMWSALRQALNISLTKKGIENKLIKILTNELNCSPFIDMTVGSFLNREDNNFP